MAKRLEVKWDGLDTFYDELQVLTAGLVDEANAIMLESCEAAKAEIASRYPFKSGGLRAGLTIVPARGTVLAGASLVQRAPHGWIYEHGTKPRENKAGQNRGASGPHPTFEPIAHAYRRTAISAVMFRLYEHGAAQVTATGEDAA
jgi:hypothetical protein